MKKDKCFVFIDFIYDTAEMTFLATPTSTNVPKKIKSVCLVSLLEKISWNDVEESYRPRIESSMHRFVETLTPDNFEMLFSNSEHYAIVSRRELYEYASSNQIYDVREKVINVYFPEHKI